MNETGYINEKYALSGLTGKIIKSAMEVHKYPGNGFQEVIYQRALTIEFALQNIAFEREFEMPFLTKEKRLGQEGLTFLLKGRLWLK